MSIACGFLKPMCTVSCVQTQGGLKDPIDTHAPAAANGPLVRVAYLPDPVRGVQNKRGHRKPVPLFFGRFQRENNVEFRVRILSPSIIIQLLSNSSPLVPVFESLEHTDFHNKKQAINSYMKNLTQPQPCNLLDVSLLLGDCAVEIPLVNRPSFLCERLLSLRTSLC